MRHLLRTGPIPKTAGNSRLIDVAPPAHGEWREPDEAATETAVAAVSVPLKALPGNIGAIRDELHVLMWRDVGIVHDLAGLTHAESALGALNSRLDEIGVANRDPAYNVSWHDWLNLKSLVIVSRVITAAALARRIGPDPTRKASGLSSRIGK